MSTLPLSPATPEPKPSPPPEAPADESRAAAKPTPRWKTVVTPLLVFLLAIAVLVTVTRNWNSWEGGHIEQVTDDAYVRGDLTPLSTKVAGIVRNVDVSDYQQVHKGDLLVQLEDNDYQGEVAQASAAVEAARAAIENNRRERELQDARIQKALAGIDEAKAQIVAAQAGQDAVDASLVRAREERNRQEGLYQTHSTTLQNLEQAVAAEGSLAGQYASSDAELAEARTALRSSELAAEAERRQKSVLESQEMELAADLHAKEAGLVAAQVNLGYTKIFAPADGSVGVSGKPRSGLCLLRRRTHLDSVRQHQAGGGADSGRWHPAEDAGVLRVAESLSVCREVRTSGRGQRQGQGGGLAGIRPAELPGSGAASGELGGVEPAVAECVPGAASAAATRPPGDHRRTL